MAGINSKDFILRTVKSILTSLTTVVLVNVNKWISDKKKKEKERKKKERKKERKKKKKEKGKKIVCTQTHDYYNIC